MNNINRTVLKFFAPILIIAGILGFITPPQISLMSGAPSYNIFHLAFGAIGLLIYILKSNKGAMYFNISFGLIDLYQAIASFADWFPSEYFLWKTTDDMLHIAIGFILIFAGFSGKEKSKDKKEFA